jgi:uncharacterized protein YfaS (alpha-2-macroglobulin family)
VLAGCLHIPPSVAPTASLAPLGAKGGGPRTESAFAVAWAGPRGDVTDRIDPAITVLFNRSMRSLETPEDQALPKLDVRTKEGAVVAGTLRWVGTRGLLFVPDKPIPGASRVVVSVPADTKTIDGTLLGAPYSFELSTPAPAVARAFPAAGSTSLRPDASIVLVMNQDVAPPSLQASSRLVAHRADGDAGEPIAFHVTRAPATPNQRPDEQAYRVTPDKPLPLDVGIKLTLAEGLRGTEGPMPMEKTFTMGVRTYGPLRLASFHCPRIAREGRCKAHNDIKVTLTNPVDPEELKRHLNAPALLAKPNPKAKKRAPQTSVDHWLSADPQLGKKYKVTLTAGMKDIFGQTLASDASFEVEVEAPFTGTPPPPAGKHAGAKPAKRAAPTSTAHVAHAAPAPTPNVPHRPQLDYRLQLGLSGTVLEALATSGTKTHKLPLGSVNIPTYQLSTSRIAEAQALAWLGGTSVGDFLQRNHIQTDFITQAEAENVRSVRTVDLDALLGKPGRGVALVAFGVPGEAARSTMVRVTDLGVTAKASRLGSLVWVTSLATGKPVTGATVSLRTPEKGEVLALKTDDQGMAEIPADRFDPFGDTKENGPAKPPAFLFVRSGDDWTFERLQRGSIDQRAASSFQNFNKNLDGVGMVYTDRGVYRPGETLKVAGIFRSIDVAGMHAIVGDEVRVEAQDPSGETVFSTRVPLDKFGGFATDVKLPKAAHLGDARVVASVRGRAHNAEAVEVFRIASYKASEFKLDVDADAKTYVRGDDAVFSLKSEYLFGGAMVGAAAHTTLTRAVTTFTPPGADGFTLSDEAATADEAETNLRTADLGASDETLDAEGRASRKLRLAMPGQTLPELVTFEAEVADTSRQTVAQRTSVLVHPAEFYVAIKRRAERFASAGGNLRAEVAAIDPTGAHRAGAAVKLELFERKWIGAVEEHGNEGAHRSSRPKDELVASCDVRTTAALAGCDLKVPEAGFFVLRASSKDARGNEARASESFYGVEDSPRPNGSLAWADNDSRVLRLETNKKTYDIGESARVVLRSPFRDAQALVTVERGGVILRKTVRVAGALPVIDVPVTPEMYPNAYVSVHLVRGRVGAPPEKGADLAGPEFRLGYTELDVNPDAHRLGVTITPARREYQPGEEVDVDLAVADRSGKPVESEVTFFAVDEGVLMLTGYKTPDPVPSFARRRSLGVFTVESREDLAHITPLTPGERVPYLGFETSAKGNDKGDPGGGGGPSALRADFRTTAYFQAGKLTDKEGKAKIHFKLPDNLTTFRLMAVAASDADYFGAGDAKITTSKKLMARPSLPRILRVGDEFEASIVVTSKELNDADVDVSLQAGNLALKGPASQRVKLAKGGSVEVRFPVAAMTPGEVAFEALVRAGAESDRVRVTRKVDLPVSAEMVAAYGELKDAAAISLGDLSGIRPDQGELRLRASPSALVGLSTSVERLLEYPYGCTEQLASHTLPLASLSDLAKDFGVRLPANVPHAVEEAVDAILKNQRESGGFGFWESSPSAEPWLSAYVVLTLDAAKKSGAPVSASALDSAVGYLRGVLGRAELAEPDAEREAEGQTEQRTNQRGLSREEIGRVDYANAAFIADALATIGSPDAGAQSRLYDARKGKPLGARALLLHAMVMGKASPDPITTLAKELETDLRIDANEAVARYDDDEAGRTYFESTARTTALVLRAFVAADKHHPLAPRIARGLLGLRSNGAWRSTQENGWALLALRDYRLAQESSTKEMEARAFLGRDMVASRVFQGAADAELSAVVPAARVIAAGGGPVAFQLIGDGQLFYAAELKYATSALPREARDEGLFVKKLVRAVKPEEIKEAVQWIPKKSLDQAQAGSLVLVDLLLESADARRQVVIDDPLPAGLEPIDAALDTSSKSRTVDDEDGQKQEDKPNEKKVHRPDALTGIGAAFRPARTHREMHDDRVLTFIEDLPPGMYHFRYLARATSIGKFVVPPTRVEAMYSPEVWGSTAAGSFEVRAKP